MPYTTKIYSPPLAALRAILKAKGLTPQQVDAQIQSTYAAGFDPFSTDIALTGGPIITSSNLDFRNSTKYQTVVLSGASTYTNLVDASAGPTSVDFTSISDSATSLVLKSSSPEKGLGCFFQVRAKDTLQGRASVNIAIELYNGSGVSTLDLSVVLKDITATGLFFVPGLEYRYGNSVAQTITNVGAAYTASVATSPQERDELGVVPVTFVSSLPASAAEQRVTLTLSNAVIDARYLPATARDYATLMGMALAQGLFIPNFSEF